MHLEMSLFSVHSHVVASQAFFLPPRAPLQCLILLYEKDTFFLIFEFSNEEVKNISRRQIHSPSLPVQCTGSVCAHHTLSAAFAARAVVTFMLCHPSRASPKVSISSGPPPSSPWLLSFSLRTPDSTSSMRNKTAAASMAAL